MPMTDHYLVVDIEKDLPQHGLYLVIPSQPQTRRHHEPVRGQVCICLYVCMMHKIVSRTWYPDSTEETPNSYTIILCTAVPGTWKVPVWYNQHVLY